MENLAVYSRVVKAAVIFLLVEIRYLYEELFMLQKGILTMRTKRYSKQLMKRAMRAQTSCQNAALRRRGSGRMVSLSIVLEVVDPLSSVPWQYLALWQIRHKFQRFTLALSLG